MERKKLELHGYYYDGKQMYTMYIDEDGKITIKKEKLWNGKEEDN